MASLCPRIGLGFRQVLGHIRYLTGIFSPPEMLIDSTGNPDQLTLALASPEKIVFQTKK